MKTIFRTSFSSRIKNILALKEKSAQAFDKLDNVYKNTYHKELDGILSYYFTLSFKIQLENEQRFYYVNFTEKATMYTRSSRKSGIYPDWIEVTEDSFVEILNLVWDSIDQAYCRRIAHHHVNSYYSRDLENTYRTWKRNQLKRQQKLEEIIPGYKAIIILGML